MPADVREFSDASAPAAAHDSCMSIALAFAVLALASPSASAPPVQLDCATAKRIAATPGKPYWFPVPEPRGVFHASGDALPWFLRGLKWTSGRTYLFLVRIPGGANLGDIGLQSKVAAKPRLANVGRTVEVLRLPDGRLFVQWPTRRVYPDLTAVVAKGVTVARYVAFLRSLRPIAWPGGCTG